MTTAPIPNELTGNYGKNKTFVKPIKYDDVPMLQSNKSTTVSNSGGLMIGSVVKYDPVRWSGWDWLSRMVTGGVTGYSFIVGPNQAEIRAACAADLGPEFTYTGKSANYDDIPCEKGEYASNLYTEVKQTCCVDGYNKYMGVLGLTCAPNVGGYNRYTNFTDCDGPMSDYCTKDRLFTDPKCKKWVSSIPSAQRLSGTGAYGVYYEHCVDDNNMPNAECQAIRTVFRDNSETYNKFMKDFCNKNDGINFGTPVCRTWCKDNPDGKLQCDEGAITFCENNPDDPICSCLNSPILKATADNPTGAINPVCIDINCLNDGYKPSKFSDPCPDVITCSMQIDIKNVMGNVALDDNKFEQNCGGGESSSSSNVEINKPDTTDNINKLKSSYDDQTIFIFVIIVVVIVLGIIIGIIYILRKKKTKKSAEQARQARQAEHPTSNKHKRKSK